ncbi:MAG: GTP-binding protein [archaeon]
MVSYNEDIKRFEDELRTTKYNKRTQHHIGLVKAKIARLKDKQEARSSKGKKGEGYAVRKSGDATVILVGYPSVGKSTLLNALTNAQSRVGAYAFTTLDVIPGLLKYKDAKIQILDVPGIVRGAAAGTGRGKEVLSVIRNADLALIIADAHHVDQMQYLLKEIEDAKIRLDTRFPDVTIKKTMKGGIGIGTTVNLKQLNNLTIETVLREFKINNADVLIREDIDVDQLIDVIERNKVYLPSIRLVNKTDLFPAKEVPGLLKKAGAEMGISAEERTNINKLKDLIFSRLRFMRIYMKEPGKKADLGEPLIVFEGCTVRDVCDKLHRGFVQRFRFVRIWGKSSKFPGQKLLRLSHVLMDQDIIELHLN